jgi:uracil-DNA glycosylase family 4
MPWRPGESLDSVQERIVTCERCPRLRDYCREVGRLRKTAFRDETYWARPVPGFGDPQARVLIVGLAPAAHGANRTGRIFTGDGVGASGDFLVSALHRAGFANISTSHHVNDGLVLKDVFIAATVRCAPPANKPLPDEIEACLGHLVAEAAQLPRLEVAIALGGIAWVAWLKILARRGVAMPRPRPAFAHGALCDLTPAPRPIAPGLPTTLFGMYHPSRQNTNTGTVTPAMYDAVLQAVARRLAR